MSDELRPLTEEELRHQPLSKEDIYFKKLEEERLAAKARREGERKLNCPVDGTALIHENYHGLIVDRCTTCKGVWLDEHEMDLMKKGLEEDPKENLLQRWMKNILPYQH